MPKYQIGARAHDYGRGTPADLFRRMRTDGWECTQLAYKKAVEGVSELTDVTPELVEETRRAFADTGLSLAVLGVYREIGSADEALRERETNVFISQMPVCCALGAPCMGTETTPMEKQPAGTTMREAQRQLMRSLEAIVPAAEEAGVTVAIEPVWHHALCTAEFTKEVLDTMGSDCLRVLFDPANLLSREWMDRQDELFGRAVELWGDKIVGIHFKGIRYDAQGVRSACRLEQSQVDYASVFRRLSQLPQSVLPVLREEAVPAAAASDIAFMRSFFGAQEG